MKSWLGAGTGPVSKKSEIWGSECWIVSIPIKYRSCSFRIVGYCSSWCEHRTVRTTVPEPDVVVAGLKRSAKSDQKNEDATPRVPT